MHSHEVQKQEARAGKGEVLSSDFRNIDSVASNLAVDFSRATPVVQGDGSVKNCVEKEEFREELKKDPVLECLHKSVEKCHYTYKTQFVPIQEEVWDENFVKLCTISYRKIAVNETFLHCYNPLVRDCSLPDTGEETCRLYYESSCTTKYVEKTPGKFVGDTSCEKLPINLCGDMSCRMVPGEEQCHNKTTASVMDQPEEQCELSPQKTCRHKTTLVPRLKPENECTIVPREICNIKYVNTRVERVPYKSLWCQDEEEPIEVFEDEKSNAEPLPGYQPEEEIEVFEDEKSDAEPLPDYGAEEEMEIFEDEKANADLFPGYESEQPGYDYPVPMEPLQPPSQFLPPTLAIIEDFTFPPDILPPVEVPDVAIDVPAAPEPITRPALRTTTTQAPTTTQTLATQRPKTVELRPEDLQSAVAEAIRQSVQTAISRAFQIQEATRNSQQSLKLTLQTAVEAAVRRAVIDSVQIQTESRRPQSSRDLELAVQSAVRNAVESSVEKILKSTTKTEVVMTSGMKTELNAMEDLIQRAVLQAVRSAVRAAVNSARSQTVGNTFRKESNLNAQAV